MVANRGRFHRRLTIPGVNIGPGGKQASAQNNRSPPGHLVRRQHQLERHSLVRHHPSRHAIPSKLGLRRRGACPPDLPAPRGGLAGHAPGLSLHRQPPIRGSWAIPGADLPRQLLTGESTPSPTESHAVAPRSSSPSTWWSPTTSCHRQAPIEALDAWSRQPNWQVVRVGDEHLRGRSQA